MAGLQRLRASLSSVRRRLCDERGSLTTYFVSAVPAVMMLTGLVVDGSGQIRALQQANDISAEAARYAGQQVDAGCATMGAEIGITPTQARQAAERYVENAPSDVTLEGVSVQGEHTVVVRTTTTYDPVFLGLFGVGTRTVEGEGTAYQYRTDAQGEEYDPDVGSWGRCQSW